MPFNRDILLEAFDEIGATALAKGEKLELAVYGGSALMLAGNFRFATEDVDVRDATTNQPEWLRDEILAIAKRNGWSNDWLNDAVAFHLSPLASRSADHLEFGSFPRGAGPYGLDVLVPTAEYMLALKLKAMRVLDPVRGRQEAADILNLMRVAHIASFEQAIEVFRRYFPKSAEASEKHMFLLKRLRTLAEPADAPSYPVRSGATHKMRDAGRNDAQ